MNNSLPSCQKHWEKQQGHVWMSRLRSSWADERRPAADKSSSLVALLSPEEDIVPIPLQPSAPTGENSNTWSKPQHICQHAASAAQASANTTLKTIKQRDSSCSSTAARLLLLLRWYSWSPALRQSIRKPVWSAALCGKNTMLHAECCEKGVRRWVPRRSTAPGPIAEGAEHANEVIMLCLSVAFTLLYSVQPACHRRARVTQPSSHVTRCTVWSGSAWTTGRKASRWCVVQ